MLASAIIAYVPVNLAAFKLGDIQLVPLGAGLHMIPDSYVSYTTRQIAMPSRDY